MAPISTAITAEEFEVWLTPRAAIRLSGLSWDRAVELIYKRLQYGHIKAAARRYNFRGQEGEYFRLDPQIWAQAEEMGGSNFWSAGDIKIGILYDSYSARTSVLALFGVRLDPAGIQELAAAHSAEPAPQPTPKTDEPEQQKGPRVSDDLLRKWHELYKQAYPGAQDTEDRAIASASGMFPGKSVVRDRVRELRGPQRRGRKAQDKS